MPSASKAVDTSVKWKPHTCGYRHAATATCPGAMWLVLSMCRDCSPRTGIYCGRHRS